MNSANSKNLLLIYEKKRGLTQSIITTISLILTPLLFAIMIGGGRFSEYVNSPLEGWPTYLRIISFFLFLLTTFIFLASFIYRRTGDFKVFGNKIHWSNYNIDIESISSFRLSLIPNAGIEKYHLNISTKDERLNVIIRANKQEKASLIETIGKNKLTFS
ncbi:hypothetical protein [Ekhidna sp.]|uniref:hypothetical protein n=1 Tax=Ekhidna sp. TaxID=2608089 RepID=UPI00329A27C9